MARTIALPDGVVAISGLDPIHYREAFSVDVDGHPSARAWARHAMEGAPGWMRTVMLDGWRTLGIELAPLDAADAVLGWRILTDDGEAIVLGIRSPLGLTARIVMLTRPNRVVHAMVVRHETVASRLAWAAIAPPHRAFVRRLLDVAAANSTAATD